MNDPSTPPDADSTLDAETVWDPTRHDGDAPATSDEITAASAHWSGKNVPEDVGWPSRVGAYRIVDLLGVGGMGRVFLAEQTEPLARRVAIKLIGVGSGQPRLLRRFQTEARALARMSHPNIAQVFEAGTSEAGEPYIVMELIEGPSLTVLADERRMGVRQRLELFAAVCDGIQHAHEKAIIHRDIKPSNILVATVDGQPIPKVIDFGIAKAIDQGVPGTQTRRVVGTPGYLSPEAIMAVDGGDLDTRSDVYSLGVLLYELMVGRPPFGGGASLDVLRRVMDLEPLRPSVFFAGLETEARAKLAGRRGTDPRTWGQRLRGELDWIILKALAKDPQQRYATAAALASEVRRLLDHRPVLAGPPSALYRARKLLRRHVAAFAAAALVTLSLVGGLVARGQEAQRANREAARANAQADAARQVSDFLVSLFQHADPGSELRSDATARELLDRGAVRIRRDLTDQPLARARLMDTIAAAYVQLSLHHDAEPLLREALALREAYQGADHVDVGESLVALGTLLRQDGQLDEAEPLLRRAIAILARPGVASPDATGHRSPEALRAGCLMELSNIVATKGQPLVAEPLLREALDLRRAVLDPDDPAIAASLNNLGNLYFDLQRFEEAERVHLESIAIKERRLGPDHFHLAQSLNNLANVHLERGELDRAEALHQRALSIKRHALPAEHVEIGVSLHNLGNIARQRGRLDEAIDLQVEALAVFEAALPADHPFVGYAAAGLAQAYRDDGQVQAAAPWFARALSIRERLDPASPVLRETVDDYVRLLRDLGRTADADAVADRFPVTSS